MSRLMLVTLTISQWSTTKKDEVVSRKAAEAEGADPALAGNYNKRLLPKDRLSEIKLIIRQCRADHERLTGAYIAKGDRILTTDLYGEYVVMVAAAKSNLAVAVDALAAHLDAAIAEAQYYLGAMFDATEYPTAEELRKAFSISSDFAPMPESDQVKAWVKDLGDDQVAALEESFAKAKQLALDAAHAAVVERLVGRCRKFIARLDAKELGGQIYSETLSILLDEAILVAKGLGIHDDPSLIDLAEAVQAAIASTSVDKLRTSETERAKRRADIDSALKKFEGVI